MSTQTLKLNKQELTDLILETYQEVMYFGGSNPQEYLNKLRGGVKSKIIPEQAYIDADGEIFLDPNQSMETNKKVINKLFEEQKRIDAYVKANWPVQYENGASTSKDSWWDYHMVLDVVAIILYVAGALTVQFYGLGIVLELLAIMVELGNAYCYAVGCKEGEEPDYFLAGLTASFTIFPVGNVIMKTVFKPFTTSMSAMFKEVAKKGTVKVSTMVKYLGSETLTLLQKAIVKSGALKHIKKLPGWIDKAIAGLKNFRSWAKDSWFFQWLVKPITWLIDKFLKILKPVVVLFVMVITEMSLYDPATTASILDFFGFKSTADWFANSPKVLLSFWNGVLEDRGSIRGAITTTPYDCNRSTYEWDDVVSAFNGEFGEKYGWEPTDDDIWTEWSKGWHPESTDEGSVVFYEMSAVPELVANFPKELKDCYRFTELYHSEGGNNPKMEELWTMYYDEI